MTVIYNIKVPVYVYTSKGPERSRKGFPYSKMARDSRSIKGRGFQTVLSRNLVKQDSPFKNAVENYPSLLSLLRKHTCHGKIYKLPLL